MDRRGFVMSGGALALFARGGMPDRAAAAAPASIAVDDLRSAVGSSRVDLQACKLEYSIVSPK